MADMFQTADAGQFRRKALLGELGVGGEPGNTGINGAPDVSQLAGPPLAASPAMSASPLGVGVQGGMDLAGKVAKPEAPAVDGPKSPFQSGNASVSGYLTDAMNAFAPTIRGIGDEAGRKKALNEYVTGLAPEVEKRGGHISDIHGDGANVDGRRIDFFGDVEGAATPQYLDVTDQQNAPQGGAPGFGGVSLDSALNGDPLAKIKEAIAALSAGRPNAAALMQQLGGGQ